MLWLKAILHCVLIVWIALCNWLWLARLLAVHTKWHCATWCCPHVIQSLKLLEASLRGKENIAKTTCEFDSSASPLAWHICIWCSILQLTWWPWLKQILHKILLHKLLHKSLSFTWTQLWVRWQTHSRYFQIATSKFQVINFLCIILLTPKYLKWPKVFWKICGLHPFCVHVIHPFRRTCGNNKQSFMVRVD